MSATKAVVLRDLLSGIRPEDYGEFRVLYPGVDILHLYGAEDRGTGERAKEPAAAFIRYQPGAKVPPHYHPGYEHIIVLEGAQSDASGEYQKGTCVVNPPGTRHAVTSESGCLVLAIWNQPVEVVGEGVES